MTRAGSWLFERWAYLRIVLLVAALAVGAILLASDTPDASDEGEDRSCIEHQIDEGRSPEAAADICGS